MQNTTFASIFFFSFVIFHAFLCLLKGRNILAQQDSRYDFGYNGSVWIDKERIYPANSTKSYAYNSSQKTIPLVSSEESFELNTLKKNFATRYYELCEINKRIMGVATEK